MVITIVIYGAIVWANRTSLKTILLELDTIQGLACVGITRIMRSCPIEELNDLLDLCSEHKSFRDYG